MLTQLYHEIYESVAGNVELSFLDVMRKMTYRHYSHAYYILEQQMDRTAIVDDAQIYMEALYRVRQLNGV